MTILNAYLKLTESKLSIHFYYTVPKLCLHSGVVLLVRQGMVRWPRHCPRVDVVELAPRPWPPSLVALSFWIRTWSSPHEGRNSAVLSSRSQRQPAEDRRHGYNVDDRFGAWLVQLFRARNPCLAPPGRLPAGAQGIVCIFMMLSGTPGAGWGTSFESVHQCGQNMSEH